MKNEKFCFSKGTGLIALVGIVLVAAALLMSGVSQKSTSTSTRASAPRGAAQPSWSTTFNRLMPVAEKLMLEFPDDAQLKTLKNDANDKFVILRGGGALSTGINASESISNRELVNLNIYLKGVVTAQNNVINDVSLANYYASAVSYIEEVISKVENFTKLIDKNKPLPLTGINLTDLPRITKPSGVSNDFIRETNASVANINMKLGQSRAAFVSLYNHMATVKTEDELSRLDSGAPIVTEAVQQAGVTVIPNPNVTETVVITPVAPQTCYDDPSQASQFEPDTLGCDVCTESKIMSLKAQYGILPKVNYFASNDIKGVRTCYELFAQPRRSSAKVQNMECGHESCTLCTNKAVAVEKCNGIPAQCGPDKVALTAIVAKYDENDFKGFQRAIGEHFLTRNTQTKMYDAQGNKLTYGTCYLKKGDVVGASPDQASYEGAITGRCANKQLTMEFNNVCACTSLSGVTAETKTCRTARDMIESMTKGK